MFNEKKLPELSPDVNTLEEILTDGKLSRISSPQEIKTIKECLANLKKIEAQRQQEKFQEKLIKKIEKETFWQDAKKIVQTIKFSAGYRVEILFDKNKLVSGNIEIRKSGKQFRHITPIAIVEKIIMDSLILDNTPNDILIALQSKIEIFKTNCTPEDNDYIQKIFSYFSHPEYKNAYGITILIKIIASLYNETFLLVTRDNGIQIPSLNKCYLIPTLLESSTTYLHKKEGTFIKELVKILSHFEKKVGEGKELSATEIKQMQYAVFAMFDYLPLPLGIKCRGREFDVEKDRHENESLKRLYKIAAKHLCFVFEAYPGLEGYRPHIFEGFLSYLSDGVKLENLCNLFYRTANTFYAFKGKTNLEKKYVENNLIKKGFAAQYDEDASSFYSALKKKVETILMTYKPDYLYNIHPEMNNPETPMTVSRKEDIKLFFDIYALEYLYKSYLQERNFDKISLGLLKIDVSKLESTFKNNITELINEEMQDSFNKKDLKKLNSLSTSNKNFHEVLFSIKENYAYEFYQLVKKSVSKAYDCAKTEESEIDKPDISRLRQRVLELRSASAKRKLTYSGASSDELDLNYSPNASTNSGTVSDTASSSSIEDLPSSFSHKGEFKSAPIMNVPKEKSKFYITLLKEALLYGSDILKYLPKEDDFFSETNKKLQVNASDYGYKCVNVEAKGNCFYLAVADQLKLVLKLECDSAKIKLLAAGLRKLACEHIEQHRQIYEEFLDDKVKLKEQAQDKVWVEDILITALCYALNINLISVRSDSQEPTIKKLPQGICTLTLGYQVELHYQSLYPLDNDSNKSKQALLRKKSDAAPIYELPAPVTVTTETDLRIKLQDLLKANQMKVQVNQALYDELMRSQGEMDDEAAIQKAIQASLEIRGMGEAQDSHNPKIEQAQKSLSKREEVPPENKSLPHDNTQFSVESTKSDDVSATIGKKNKPSQEKASDEFKKLISDSVGCDQKMKRFAFKVTKYKDDVHGLCIQFITPKGESDLGLNDIKKRLIRLKNTLADDLAKKGFVDGEDYNIEKFDAKAGTLIITSEDFTILNQIGALLKDAGQNYWNPAQLASSTVLFFKPQKKMQSTRPQNTTAADEQRTDEITCSMQ